MKKYLSIVIMLVVVLFASAMTMTLLPPPDGKKGAGGPGGDGKVEQAKGDANGSKADDKKAAKKKSSLEKYREQMAKLKLQQDSIPDSLLHPRWKIQKTVPVTYDDLKQGPADLQRPENLKQEVEYNDTIDRYIIGSRLGKTWINTPVMMNLVDYQKWSEKNLFYNYFRQKNSEIFQEKGKEKFDWSDMHFDLGPAEKIFGPGGIRVKTQGSAEVKVGATIKNIDNPSLPISNRNTTTIDFDEKININVTGSIGDKMKMNLNYNTDATFDYDAQNMKLKYDGKEDEIIKLVEAGNVSFPSNSSLIQGASSLFGVRADMQFGKLKLQTVFSQKKSTSSSVASQGGVQLTPFEMDVTKYEENRHFFLSQYFRNRYDAWMKTLPTVSTGVTINRVEVWVTNKNGQTSNTRDIIALARLGDDATGSIVPQNNNEGLYSNFNSSTWEAARDITQTNTILDGDLESGVEYEKIEKARLLNSSEYTVNTAMGYISLKSTLQSDQVLAIAYEYTYGGTTYQVGEFTADNTDVSKALVVKSLKNTSCVPTMPNWKLMMRNVYYLSSSLQKEKFKLDVKYQSDSVGVYVNYIPETLSKGTPIIKLIGADRLDNNNRPNSNGRFDYVEGYTISNGRVFFPTAEPFGTTLYNALISKGVPATIASKYRYQELYDTTKTAAKQMAEKNRFQMVGQFKGTSANVISLGATNVPQGSVVVTAGGVTLTEGTDYSVDYSAGEVTILNQSIIDAGTAINCSVESQADYGMERKTMFGINWEYDFSKYFQISGTLQHLSEQTLTSKVTMGNDPVNNTLIGFNFNWKHDSQWLTNMLNKIPLLHVTQPSNIQLNAEFAKLFSSTASGTQDNASYIDDFESATNGISVLTPSSWTLASVPQYLHCDDGGIMPTIDKNSLTSGFNRARLAWYTVDPIFTNRSSSLTPSHIKSDLDQLSNHYVRSVYVRELYPNRDQSTYTGATSTLSILNMAYYPEERGPYNFNPQMDNMGHLLNPSASWGGMMRKLDTNDFEEANIEYIEFWMMDPFIYTGQDGTAKRHTGQLHINLGEMSEDILHDGRKFYESGMPVVDGEKTDTTQWGRIPVQNTVTYAFATSDGSRERQDVGYNGLTDAEELNWPYYKEYLDAALGPNHDGVGGIVTNDSVKELLLKDPAFDDYHYFRGSDWDADSVSILNRYKFINNPQGNSPDSGSRTDNYDTSYKTTPDVEDINQDYTLNESEKYFDYCIEIDTTRMKVGDNYISDIREAAASLRNGTTVPVKWYLFRVPINQGIPHGGISDFSSIRFMRMYMQGFEETTILRFGSLDLVHGDWRVYEQQIKGSNANPTATFTASAISIEENSDKKPVNYTLPPGISRVVDPSQPQLVENNEQALRFDIEDMSHADAVAVYKNTNLDLRYYSKLQMFAHANATEQNTTNLQNDQIALFVRLGSDYNNNYYEYEIPLELTPAGSYNTYSAADCKAVWPENNMLNIDLSKLTALKKTRNQLKAQGLADFSHVYSEYDADNQRNKISVVGNPSIGEVKTMMIGVRNLSSDMKDCEVWVNELRLLDPQSSGGWAAAANLNVQLSDLGSVAASGKYVSDGFGGLEQKTMQRSMNKQLSYSVTTNLELGKFFPDKWKVTIPFYYSYSRETTTPKYNPLDTDMLLDDALESAADDHERDSIKSIAITNVVSKNLSVSGVKFGISTKRHPMPYDPANFSFSYSHSHKHTDGETTVYENDDNWRGAINYSWTPVYKSLEPFKKIKSKSKYYDILKKFAFNWLPQNISANTEMTRSYYEMQERDLEDLGSTASIPVTWNSQFLWNRDFSIRWDLTKNLHMNFQSATKAEIEEPYAPVNEDLYPDQYQAWKDSVWESIKHFGKPLDYNQTFTASYQLPLNLIPIFDWLNANGTYNSSYHWARGSEQEDGSSLGNTITTNRIGNISSTLNMEKLYNHIPFLKKANERFAKSAQKNNNQKNKTQQNSKAKNDGSKPSAETMAKTKEAEKLAAAKTAEAKKKKNTYSSEITIKADTFAVLTHGKKTKRIIVSAKDENGKAIPVKFKKLDDNKIRVYNKADSAVKMKVSVLALDPLEDQKWYKIAQSAARVAMMVRNISISYRNQYSMSLPGFKPNIGDAFGQRGGGALAPGLDFAFGFVDDSYIEKAQKNGWLMGETDSVSSPATTSKTEDLQIKMTLEPIRNLKIDLNMSHTYTVNKSIQYMYTGSPTTQSGSFSMTTISIGSAFEGIGSAENGFYSASFEKFCNSLTAFQTRVQNQYTNVRYPAGTALAGKKFNAAQYGGVGLYSADVMIPAFLSAYTGSSSLSIFPGILRMLPNWTIKYSGLSQLPWIRDHFKSVNINHGYKSIYTVGSYSSYSAYKSFMGETIGFITDGTTGNPIPNSMFNISTVQINEAFSPLLGIDFTLPNNITFKAEYRTTRVLSLSMTSVQINETLSKDWVFGMGYKIADFRFFKSRALLEASKNRKNSGNDADANNNNAKTNSKSTSKTKGFAHDLNLRLDLSYRQQAAITRDIATVSSQATSGNNAFKLAFTADYSMSRLLTMSFYYDRQSNTPLLSQGSYPTVTQDFGLSLKFSLTR